MTSFVTVEEVDHLVLLVLEEGLSSEPIYRENCFIIFFTCLPPLPSGSVWRFIFYVLLVYVHVKVIIWLNRWIQLSLKSLQPLKALEFNRQLSK